MRYDIVIVGGGMVGAALACALKNPNYRIALIDAVASHAEDKRLIALNHSSCVLFKNLGIWPALAPHAAAIKTVHVSSRGHFGTTRLAAEEIDLTELGHVIPAKEINLALYAELAKLGNITLLCPTKLIGLTEFSTHVELITDTVTIETQIVIAADGTYSTVRDLLHIPTEIIDYQQKALVTITELQREHQHIAYERFLTAGAIAMLPLTGLQVATIWSGNAADIDNLLNLSDVAFLQTLQENFGYRLGKLKKIHERFVYPLKLIRTKEQLRERIILIGNAAHTVHPIAAQGLNLALYEIAVIAEHLNTKLSLTDLPDYLRQQKFSINLSHYLTQLFSSDFFVANFARQLGMVGFDVFMLAKKYFAKRALGQARKMPKLLQE
jgi:2-octaprenyl-6-methoxyphenol hydroxylase